MVEETADAPDVDVSETDEKTNRQRQTNRSLVLSSTCYNFSQNIAMSPRSTSVPV